MDHIEIVRTALKSQYRTSLAMFQEALERCDENLWIDNKAVNAYWQVAYHALFYVHMYLQPDLKSFQPWSGHQKDVQYANGIAGIPKADSPLPLLPTPYSKAQVQVFLEVCQSMVDPFLDKVDLASPQSGFPWYSCSKLEHQIISIRHLQHHTAQLGDKLRNSGSIGLEWQGHL